MKGNEMWNNFVLSLSALEKKQKIAFVTATELSKMVQHQWPSRTLNWIGSDDSPFDTFTRRS